MHFVVLVYDVCCLAVRFAFFLGVDSVRHELKIVSIFFWIFVLNLILLVCVYMWNHRCVQHVEQVSMALVLCHLVAFLSFVVELVLLAQMFEPWLLGLQYLLL